MKEHAGHLGCSACLKGRVSSKKGKVPERIHRRGLDSVEGQCSVCAEASPPVTFSKLPDASSPTSVLSHAWGAAKLLLRGVSDPPPPTCTTLHNFLARQPCWRGCLRTCSSAPCGGSCSFLRWVPPQPAVGADASWTPRGRGTVLAHQAAARHVCTSTPTLFVQAPAGRGVGAPGRRGESQQPKRGPEGLWFKGSLPSRCS